MRFKRFFRSMLTGMSLAAVVPLASASILTVSGSMPSALLAQGATASGVFDINQGAAALGYSTPYNISSASMTFNFADNADPAVVTRTFAESNLVRLQDVCTGSLQSSCAARYIWVDNYRDQELDPIETATVNSGGMSGTASSNYSERLGFTDYRTAGYTRCRYLTFFGTTICDGPWPVYNQSQYWYVTYSGAFSISMNLDSAALQDISTDGLMDFSIIASLGNFNFLSASLSVDLQDSGGGGTSVPEPGTLTLLGLGLLGFAASRYKKKAQAQA